MLCTLFERQFIFLSKTREKTTHINENLVPQDKSVVTFFIAIFGYMGNKFKAILQVVSHSVFSRSIKVIK